VVTFLADTAKRKIGPEQKILEGKNGARIERSKWAVSNESSQSSRGQKRTWGKNVLAGS